METEIYKDIDGYEGVYMISNHGNVKSLKYGRQRILSVGNHKNYFHVVLCLNGITKIKKVHRLVAEAFIPNPDNKLTVNHKDGNPSNNNVENLEWCTQKENVIHSFEILGRKASFGGLGRFGKLHCGSKKVIQLKDGIEINRFNGMSEANRITGISFKKISDVCNGRAKKASGYEWKIANQNEE